MKPNEHVGKVRSLINGYKSTYVLTAAARIGVFSVLEGRAMTSMEIAEELSLDVQKIEPVLNAIAYYGLIEKNGDVYELCEFADVLSPNSPQSQLGYINHALNMCDKWRNLEMAMRTTSESLANFSGLTGGDKQTTKAFLEAMNTNAIPQSKYIVSNNDFTNHCFIDIGAGYGTYSIAVVRNYATAKGVALDLPVAAEIIQENVDAQDLGDRISVLSGNYKSDLPNELFDDAFLFAIIHQENMKNAQTLLNDTYKIVKEGGKLFLTSFFLDETKTAPEFSVLFGVEMLVGTGQGRVYTHGEVEKMLYNAGFSVVERDDKIPGPATLYVATK